MEAEEEIRPDPDKILEGISKTAKGKLTVFLGMCAGVGKTYSMLESAHRAKTEGKDVVIGYVETHRRAETDALTQGLEIIPRKRIDYKGIFVEETDIDGIIKRKPFIVLIDELAHTNAAGSRHIKRYQDVLELLDNGINVYTALNVQHIESRTDVVAKITGIRVQETVPDSILDEASEIELIDISPENLLKRFKEGKVYVPDRAKNAMSNFFRYGNITALREMSLRITADRVEKQLTDYMQKENIVGPWKSGEKILVAVSPSPYSSDLIRWAKRLSYNLKAKWIAVYVDNLKQLNDEAGKRLESNIALAKELGAEIVKTSDDDTVKGILRIARQNNVSQIVVGKPAENPVWSWLKGKNIVNRLILESGDIDVYVVRASKNRKKIFDNLYDFKPTSPAKQYFYSVLSVIALGLICFPVRDFIGYQSIGLLFLLLIAVLPLFVGRGAVIAGAFTFGIIWNFFFIPPLFTFRIDKAHDWITLSVSFTIAIVSSFLTSKIKRQTESVKQREEHAVAMFNFTDELSKSDSIDSIIETYISRTSKYFKAMTSFFIPNANSKLILFKNSDGFQELDTKEFNVAEWTFANMQKAGRFTDNIPSADGSYFPVYSTRCKIGVFGIELRNHGNLKIDDEILINNFTQQFVTAFENAKAEENAQKLLIASESEKLYKTLINSISHELKTPIAIISGASGTLIEADNKLTGENIGELLSEINVASGRLGRLVENLLDMTRLESGMMKLNLEWCDINDLISVVLKESEENLAQHRIITDLNHNLPLIKIDFVLIAQAIKNILQNATIYTPVNSEINIKSDLKNNKIQLVISDNGPGIPSDSIPKIFDKFYRVPGSKAGGTGLGLSIVKGFIEAHNGVISVQNNPGGGAKFTIIFDGSETQKMTGIEPE